jgi:FAD/FMN-containing dehydrogenase
MKPATSWGRYPLDHRAAAEIVLHDLDLAAGIGATASVLAHGMGRSYGDVALNKGGTILHTRRLDRFIAFDAATGVLRAEAGATLDEILSVTTPRGWFLAVTPGTRYVSLGGAVANDVHGKNHHTAGSFGHHVRAFELIRSDGTRTECSPTRSPELFAATVGGLGLTGLITWVEIQLTPIARPHMAVQHRRFSHLNDYWAIDEEWGRDHEYTVAWVDCLKGGRGIYSAANFLKSGPAETPTAMPRRKFPFDPPGSLIGPLSLRAFNFSYYHQRLKSQDQVHAYKFFYPLDGIEEWNKVYGRKGFLQYQCVLPPAAMRSGSNELFKTIRQRGLGSFLAVFKTFGQHAPVGLLSFPRPGATLALDFPNQGERTLSLLNELDAVVRDAGGALYPAKDARMPASMFSQSFPRLEEFSRHVDPAFSSSFWRRVNPRHA